MNIIFFNLPIIIFASAVDVIRCDRKK